LRIATRIGEPPAKIHQRVPGRKLCGGKSGELVERIRGRCSTEVVVPRKLSWQGEEEKLYVDGEFQALYSELARRSINSSHENC
jgi:hypothetical protein